MKLLRLTWLRQGFTLIELMVVISIVALLSSIILANLSVVRDKAKVAAGLQFAATIYHTEGDQTVGQWSFDEGTGTRINDMSGNGYAGTLSNNSMWSSDTPNGTGSSLYFSGNTYIDFSAYPAPFSGTGPLTLSLWVKTTISDAYIIQQRGAQNNGEYVLAVAGGKVQYWDNGSGNYGFTGLNSNTPINDGKWHHIAFIRNGLVGSIYIDGALNNSETSTTVINIQNTCPFAIGKDFRDNARYFKGNIDDVHVYAKSLTADAIHTEYLAGLASHRNLVLK